MEDILLKILSKVLILVKSVIDLICTFKNKSV